MEKTLIIGFSVAMIVASFLIGWWAKRKVTSNKAFFGSTGMFGPLAVGLSSTAAVASEPAGRVSRNSLSSPV